MVVDFLLGAEFIRAVGLALLGVGFWVGGLVVANYLWNARRDDTLASREDD